MVIDMCVKGIEIAFVSTISVRVSREVGGH